MHCEVEMETIEVCNRKTFQVHKHLVKVLSCSFRITPYFVNCLNVIVEINQIVEEHICLITVEFVCEGIVVSVSKMITCSTFSEDLVRVGVESLPVGSCLPDGSSGTDGVMESCVHSRVCALF